MYSRKSRHSMLNSLKMQTNKDIKKMENMKQELFQYMIELQEDINETMDRILQLERNIATREPRSVTVFANMDHITNNLVYMMSEKNKMDQMYNQLHSEILKKLDTYERLIVRSHSPVRKSNSKTKKKHHSI